MLKSLSSVSIHARQLGFLKEVLFQVRGNFRDDYNPVWGPVGWNGLSLQKVQIRGFGYHSGDLWGNGKLKLFNFLSNQLSVILGHETLLTMNTLCLLMLQLKLFIYFISNQPSMTLGCEIFLTMHTLLANAVCADSFPDDDAIQQNHHKLMAQCSRLLLPM